MEAVLVAVLELVDNGNLKFPGDSRVGSIPTSHTKKGYMWDSESGEGGKVYLDSGELRELANSCIEVANWLDERAAQNDHNSG